MDLFTISITGETDRILLLLEDAVSSLPELWGSFRRLLPFRGPGEGMGGRDRLSVLEGDWGIEGNISVHTDLECDEGGGVPANRSSDICFIQAGVAVVSSEGEDSTPLLECDFPGLGDRARDGGTRENRSPSSTF